MASRWRNLAAGPKARITFDRADSGETIIVIPSIVMAEALYLAEKGRTRTKPEQILEMVSNALNYRVYPLDLQIIHLAWEQRKLTEIHDRVIVATAKHLGFELITKDTEIRESGHIPTLW